MKFLGAPYPIVPHPRGYLHVQSDSNQVKSDLLILLLTYPGERVFLPRFGTPLKDLIFEPNDDALKEKARDMIINSIKTWEPRITVQSIEVTSGPELLPPNDSGVNSANYLNIKIIFFDPESISEIQTLELEVPLAG